MSQLNSTAPLTLGTHHLGLTVPDLAKTRAFFVDTLGLQQVGEKPDYPAVFLSDGTTMITLWQAKDPANARPFDRENSIGLHHFAMRVENAEALDELHTKLQATEGVEFEFEPEPLGGGPAQHMMFYIPGGIRMELIAPSA
jgi:catechol 2,3-dioxygenase-like lactoylglutathione lyase family enzyme